MAQGLKDYWILSDAVSTTAETKVVADIPPKTFVSEVICLVTTAYETSDAATLDVGDAADEDIWVDNQDITETTAGAYRGTATNGATQAPTGKYYSSGTQIKIKVGGTNTAGEARALIHCLSLPL